LFTFNWFAYVAVLLAYLSVMQYQRIAHVGALFVALVATVVVAEPAAEAKPECTIKQLILRDAANGNPVQVEQVDDGFVATMCTDVENFRAQIKQTEPIFAAGVSCSVGGSPKGAVSVGGGAQKVFKMEAFATKRQGGNGKLGEVFMGRTSTPYELTVKRLGVAGDAKKCEVTRSYGAAEDCGFAPMIEKHRQAAAIIKGNQPQVPDVAPTAEPAPAVVVAPTAAPAIVVLKLEGAACLTPSIPKMLASIQGKECPADFQVDDVGGRGCPCDHAFVAAAEKMLADCCPADNKEPECIEWNDKMNSEQGLKNFVAFACSGPGFLKLHQHIAKTQVHF